MPASVMTILSAWSALSLSALPGINSTCTTLNHADLAMIWVHDSTLAIPK